MSEDAADQSVVVSTQAAYSLLTAEPSSVYVEGNIQDVATVVFENNTNQVLHIQEGEGQPMEMDGAELGGMEVDDDLEEFMNVITTYQCKMCEFSSVHLEEFSGHVRAVHKKAKNNLVRPESSMSQEHDGQGEGNDTLVFTDGSGLVSETDEQMTQSEQAVIQVSENVVSYENDSSNSVMPLITTEAEPTQDKELYVCATCGLAFSNIENCKDHMIQDHNVGVMESINSKTEPQSNQVSVGTQAQTKRPGRKRNEDRPRPSPPASVIVLSDEEGEELTDIVETYETSNKRKVRPPKALTQLYYISKQKTHTRVNRVNPLACPISQCTASFKTQEALDLHLSCHIPAGKKTKKPWECPQCQTQFNQWKQIRMHLWSDHQMDTDLLKCAHCEFRTDSQHRLETHEELHSSDQVFKCQICNKIFKHRQMLKDHTLVHTGKAKPSKKAKSTPEKSDKWFSGRQCPVCSRTLANERCLNKHIEAVHSKETLYHCPHCSYTATRKAMMQLHVRTHTGDKPFSCNQCEYKTADHNTLRRHVMRHTGIRPYKCQLCNYSAIQAISLKNHIKSRHPGGQGLYSCDQCNFVSVNEKLYKDHLEDHKNGLVVPKVTTAQTTNIPEGQVIQVIKKGPLGEGDVLSSRLPASQMIYTAINALNQDNLQESANANNMGHTITLHLPNNGNGEEMEVVNEIDGQQVVMIQEDVAAQHEGAVTYTTDGQIVHTLSQLSEEMMQAISASCNSGQQVTINIAGETGELIITTAEGGEVVVPDMAKNCDFQTIEQQTISIEPVAETLEPATETLEQLPNENVVQMKETL